MTNEPAGMLEAAAWRLRAGVVTSEPQLIADFLYATAEHVRSHDCEAHCEYPDGCLQTRTAMHQARAILGPGWAMQQAAADLASIEQEDA